MKVKKVKEAYQWRKRKAQRVIVQKDRVAEAKLKSLRAKKRAPKQRDRMEMFEFSIEEEPEEPQQTSTNSAQRWEKQWEEDMNKKDPHFRTYGVTKEPH